MWQNIIITVIVLLVAIISYVLYKKKKSKAEETENGSMLQDLTAMAKAGKLSKVVGVQDTIERVMHVLARKQKNNPLLLGEPGVGKTAIVEGLAQMIVDNKVPEQFLGKRVLVLNLAELMSGTKYRGALEERLRKMLTDLEKDSRHNILFIDEIHMLEQARGSDGSLDIADVLKPSLARGDLNVIGATTWQEYQKFIKPDAAFDRRFQPILVHEPSKESAIKILMGVKGEYENFHGVCIPEETIVAAVDASIKFIKDRFLPDKAFDIIDEACAKVSLEDSPSHRAYYLGLVHAASKKVKDICKTDALKVEPKDVEEIAREWRGEMKA